MTERALRFSCFVRRSLRSLAESPSIVCSKRCPWEPSIVVCRLWVVCCGVVWWVVGVVWVVKFIAWCGVGGSCWELLGLTGSGLNCCLSHPFFEDIQGICSIIFENRQEGAFRPYTKN